LVEMRTGITVAIATLERPDGLMRCLDAVERGSRRPLEIVVVDQSAGDETERLVTWRPAGGAPVRYIRQPRKGLSASRNAGIAAATGSIVAMTDDDCVPGDGWLDALARAFRAPGVSGVSGRVLPLGPESAGKYAMSSRLSPEPALFARKAPPWLAGSGGNFAVRKDVWTRLGGFDERLGAGTRGQSAEDMDFIYRMMAAGESIAYEPDAVVYHERQDLGRRTASRWSYGYGMGAACGKWLRMGDPYALRLLAGWLLWRSRGLLEALGSRQGQAVTEHRLMLGGTLAGLGYGLQLGERR
jgi:GT2 family glycosyltransferase